MTSDMHRMLHDYRLTTAEIIYFLPDFPNMLQSYVWQDYDLEPRFPTLLRFLDFWDHHLEGRLHSVQVAARELILPPAWRGTVHCDIIQ